LQRLSPSGQRATETRTPHRRTARAGKDPAQLSDVDGWMDMLLLAWLPDFLRSLVGLQWALLSL
jgi:hypothetical protein